MTSPLPVNIPGFWEEIYQAGRAGWEEFMALDDLLARIGEGADHRLAFQAVYPTH